MSYRLHPAAEAEHLGQIVFSESRRKGLGGRYRDQWGGVQPLVPEDRIEAALQVLKEFEEQDEHPG